MPNIDVDPERLRRGAEALRTNHSGLNKAAGELESAVAVGIGACDRAVDGGLDGALSRLRESWGYDINAFGKDAEGFAQLIDTLAQLYGSADHDVAMQLRS